MRRFYPLIPPFPTERVLGVQLLRKRCGRDPAVFQSQAGGIPAMPELEFLEDVVHVVFHGRDAETQAPGDLLVRKAFCEQPHDFALAASQGQNPSSD